MIGTYLVRHHGLGHLDGEEHAAGVDEQRAEEARQAAAADLALSRHVLKRTRAAQIAEHVGRFLSALPVRVGGIDRA